MAIFPLDCGWVFAQHFCNRLGPAYLALKNILDESNASHAEVLNDIKRRFREETFTRELIKDVIVAHPELVSKFRSGYMRTFFFHAEMIMSSLRFGFFTSILR